MDGRRKAFCLTVATHNIPHAYKKTQQGGRSRACATVIADLLGPRSKIRAARSSETPVDYSGERIGVRRRKVFWTRLGDRPARACGAVIHSVSKLEALAVITAVYFQCPRIWKRCLIRSAIAALHRAMFTPHLIRWKSPVYRSRMHPSLERALVLSMPVRQMWPNEDIHKTSIARP